MLARSQIRSNIRAAHLITGGIHLELVEHIERSSHDLAGSVSLPTNFQRPDLGRELPYFRHHPSPCQYVCLNYLAFLIFMSGQSVQQRVKMLIYRIVVLFERLEAVGKIDLRSTLARLARNIENRGVVIAQGLI